MTSQFGFSSGLTRRRFIAHGAGAGMALVAAPGVRTASAAEEINFQLDWIAYGRHAPYYVALDKGFYKDRGLNVTIHQGRGTLQGIRTLIAGQSQFIFQDIGVMLSVRAKEGSKIKALACMYQKTPHTFFYMKNKGINAPKDIEGKKAAFSPGDSPRLMFPAFAKANGIDESKVSWLSVDPNSKNAVLLNHFVYGEHGADFYSNGIGAMEDFIKAKPDVTKNFVQATMQGVADTLANPKEAVSILKKYQAQLDEEVALKEVEIIRTLSNANDPKQKLGFMSKEKMEATQDLMMKYLDLKE